MRLCLDAGVSAGNNVMPWDVPAEDWKYVLDVNVHGVLNMIRHFVPAMVARNKGFIVNTSSGLGHSSNPNQSVYSTSKWAVESLSKSIALGLPDGCMCVPLAPGVVRTEMNTNAAFPTAAEWSAVAAPWILNLWTSPAALAPGVKVILTPPCIFQ
jgi:NADP-dependent 3-hydroxy acid dehydrogenase YdfG